MRIDLPCIEWPNSSGVVELRLYRPGDSHPVCTFRSPPINDMHAVMWPAGVGGRTLKGDHFMVEIVQLEPEVNLDEPYGEGDDAYATQDATFFDTGDATPTGTTGAPLTAHALTNELFATLVGVDNVTNTAILDVGPEGRP